MGCSGTPGTDLGQTGNPSPADGLQLFVTDLMKAGVSKDDVTKMGREIAGSLLTAKAHDQNAVLMAPACAKARAMWMGYIG